MENASKALLIAGGILLAVLLIGLLVILWGELGSYRAIEQEKTATEQLTAFNRQYEAYQRQILRGTDIISIINKVRDNNKINEDNTDLHISWQFTIRNKNAGTMALPAGIYREENSSAYDNLANDKAAFLRFKELYFQCTKIEYSAKSGRVDNIQFEELLESELFKNENE